MNRLQTIPRFTVTYGFRDFCVGVGSLFRRNPPLPLPVDEMFPTASKFWTGSGRQALGLMLNALDLPAGAGVAVPLYTDASVFQTVAACNLTPVFVDIDENTLTMSPASLGEVRDRISAVVAVHLFGHVAPVAELQSAAPNLPLIEDTVHAPFSLLEGKLAGTMGIGCFFSFGSSKCWPAGGGGIAVLNDQRLFPGVAEAATNLEAQSLKDRSWNLVCQTAKSAVFRRPLYGAIARPLRASMERRGMLEPMLDHRAIQPGQAAVALRQMASFPARVDLQRRNSHRLLTALCDVPDIVLPRERAGTRYNYHFFPVLLTGAEERDDVTQKMLAKAVDTSRVYYNVVDYARELGYIGGCPMAESAPRRMLTLPNYAGLSDREIDYIAETFVDSLNAHRARRGSHGWVSGVATQKTGMGAR